MILRVVLSLYWCRIGRRDPRFFFTDLLGTHRIVTLFTEKFLWNVWDHAQITAQRKSLIRLWGRSRTQFAMCIRGWKIAICTLYKNFPQCPILNGHFGSNTPTSNNTNTREISLFFSLKITSILGLNPAWPYCDHMLQEPGEGDMSMSYMPPHPPPSWRGYFSSSSHCCPSSNVIITAVATLPPPTCYQQGGDEDTMISVAMGIIVAVVAIVQWRSCQALQTPTRL